jgi:hypothetical protein
MMYPLGENAFDERLTPSALVASAVELSLEDLDGKFTETVETWGDFADTWCDILTLRTT